MIRNLFMIACVSKDGGLGQGGNLLWHIKKDMDFFRETTSGSIVAMGRKTYESIGRPLPNRQNVVLSRHDVPGVKTYRDRGSLDEFLASESGKKFIIGGASLYEAYLPEAEKLYLTEVDAIQPADAYFPDFDKSGFSRKVLYSGEQDGISYDIVEYTRK